MQSQPITAALYVRTAALAQRPAHPSHEADLLAYAARRGYAVADVYTDAGVGGMSALSERPAGARLLEDARAGRFGTVVVAGMERIGRDERNVRADLAALERLGVRVETADERGPL